MTKVHAIKEEYDALAKHLNDNGEVSMSSDLNKTFAKVIFIAGGSFFEYEITKLLSDYVARKTNNDVLLVNFLKKQAISAKFHTLFYWWEHGKPEKFGSNANQFLGLFGEDFKNSVSQDIKNDENLSDAVKAFIEIGHLRNIFVHNNFAEYVYTTRTTEETFVLFEKALLFLEYLKERFK